MRVKSNLHDLNLKLKKGEILGIAGLSGHGQVELLHALFGDGDDERASALDLLDAGPHLAVQHVTAALERHDEHHQLSLIDQRYRAVPACVSSTHWILAGMPLSESMI